MGLLRLAVEGRAFHPCDTFKKSLLNGFPEYRNSAVKYTPNQLHLCRRSRSRARLEREMESKKDSGGGGGGSFFQMPLHYPRFTRKDYQHMPEWQLDTLLRQYGLSTHGDLAYKRDFAMGAFLWPEHYPNSDHPTLISKRV